MTVLPPQAFTYNAAQTPTEPDRHSATKARTTAPGLALTVPPDVIEAVAQRAAQLVVAQLATADDAWLDVDGAARYLACKPKRIYDLTSQRRLPAHRDGSRLLFRRSELDAYLEAA